jgi:hypothetical protein
VARPETAPSGALETLWLLLAAFICLTPRIAFAHLMPTVPYVDFANLVTFAVALNEPGWEAAKQWWQFFGIGLPYALSLVLRVVPGPPADVARYTTAVVTGLAALSPFVIWRGAFRLPTRMASALLLGLWPGHVLFSGVVAQDNWILLPSMALGALGARSMVRNEAWPLASAILFCAAGAIRQEMLIALLPLALAAAGAFDPSARRGRRLGVWAVATLAGLMALAGLRWAGSGRFSVGTEHAGLAILGAATPGAGNDYWTFPQIYFAAYAPELEDDWEAMRARAVPLALRELAHRPFFHCVRMFAAGVNSVARTDSATVFQAVAAPEAMPPSHRARGAALAERLRRPFGRIPLVVLGLFFAALLFGVGPRAPMLVLASAILLKIAVHAVTVAQPRYFVVVGALALLGLALAGGERGPAATPMRVACAVFAGFMFAFVVVRLGRGAEAYVLGNEEQLTYRFTVWNRVRTPRLMCRMARGLLHIDAGTATIRLLRPEPLPGDEAAVECSLEGASEETPLALELQDSYAISGRAGRIVLVVTVDGRDVLRHDIGDEPGTPWLQVPLVDEGGHTATTVAVRVQAVKPDRGWEWGKSAVTTLRLVPLRPRSIPDP